MQKAAAYDKALKDIKAVYPNLKGDVKLAVEHAFPELKESEDEKIMGDIMEAVENWLPYERVEEIRAYLREHKPTEWVLPEDFEEAVYKVANFISPFDNQEELRKTSHHFAEQLLSLAKKELDKPAEWSEEDENKLYQVMEVLLADKTIALQENPHCKALHRAYDELLDWLKSLRPQKRFYIQRKEN